LYQFLWYNTVVGKYKINYNFMFNNKIMNGLIVGIIVIISVAFIAGLFIKDRQKNNSDIKELVFGRNIKGEDLNFVPAERDPQLFSNLNFSSPKVEVSSSELLAEIDVTNTGNNEKILIVSPVGGDFPYGGQTPFWVNFSKMDNVKYSGKLFPPSPPSPKRIILPANTNVKFFAKINLKDYQWQGEPEVELKWGFEFLHGESRGGILQVKLPNKK